MRISQWRRPSTRSSARLSISWLTILTPLATLSHAITVNEIPNPNLDLSQLGQVGIAGDFSGISFYQFEGQTERLFSSNGSEQLMTLLPNGVFTNLASADAAIQSMCTFQGKVILGGLFTSLDGKESPGVASFDPTTSEIVPLAGLSGQVNSLLCDDAAGMVFVGGSFRAADSTNAITWLASNNWASLPFAGFNGPVTSIVKSPSGRIIFGGKFTGLGNASAPTTPDGQDINLSTANLQAEQGASTAGFSDPLNIVCKTGGADGAGNTWLLQDSVAGAWTATFRYRVTPTKIRLYNTHQDGRGTKTWRFTAQPRDFGGILNLTYIDPRTNQNASCTNECPLSDDPDVQFQDFHFVNPITMNAFRIDISDWYGNGGGLNGIQLFQDDVFTYAVNEFNEPSCANTTTPSRSTTTGEWAVSPSGGSSADYLSAVLSKPIASDAATAVFEPDIKESGYYMISLYTPGCRQDGTCLRRGQVDILGTLNSTTRDLKLNNAPVYQTNDFDKYDVYYGTFDASSEAFRPSITIRPVAGQVVESDDMVIVAQRIGVQLVSSTGGLNGLFEYDPSQATVNPSDFDSSAFVQLTSTFSPNSAVSALIATNDRTYIGGNFTSDNFQNIVAIGQDGQAAPLDGGLNGEVTSMILSGDQLVVGGKFNGTLDGSTSGLSNVAMYDSAGNTWIPLGAGVDDVVETVISLSVNLTGDTAEEVIALTGRFSQLLAFGDNPTANTTGFAVWVKSQSNWLQNLNTPVPLWNGILSSSLSDQQSGPLFAGSISSQALRAFGTATTGAALGNFPIKIQPPVASSNNSSNGLSRRGSLVNSMSSIAGVVTGAFDFNNQRRFTVLGGHFSAQAADGSPIFNLAVIDGTESNATTGLGAEISPDSVILSLAIQGDNVFAGGRINGTLQGSAVHGVLSYNLAAKSPGAQPPALDGPNVTVSAINVRPDTDSVYVGGNFDTAGGLPCPGVCVFTTGSSQWTRPGFELSGSVSALMWSSPSVLYAGGDLVVNETTTYLASFDASANAWKGVGAATDLPGPVDALTAANQDRNQLWVAGTQSDGVSYLMKFDGSSWVPSGIALDPETVITSLQMFTVTEDHDSSSTLDGNQVLMLTGSIGIPGFGTASGAIFNGTTIQPYALTSNADSSVGPGFISKVFVQNENFFTSPSGGGLAVGFVVLIALAISLALMLLIVVAGLALDRYRKKREGYVPAPTSMFDRASGMQRIPPAELLDSLRQGRQGPPRV